MGKTTGFEEKQEIIAQKIANDLAVLPPIFNQYAEHLNSNNKALSTVYTYLNTLTACLRTIIQNYHLSDDFYKKIEKKDISHYFDLKNDLGIQALQRHWSILNSFFEFLIENCYISQSPMDGIKRPITCKSSRNSRDVTYLNRSEVDRLFSAVKRDTTKFKSFRDEVILKLALTTGINLTEMVNLDVDHIDFSNNTICIAKKNERLIPISPSMASLLKEWLHCRNDYFDGEVTSALFVSNLKNRLSIYTVEQIIKTHCEAADLPIITYKDLKSTMVYLLAIEGVSMAAIMELLSVTDYDMIVQAYDEAMKEKNVNISEALDNLFHSSISNNTNADEKSLRSRRFNIELKLPEYSKFTGGGEGFTIFGNITNKLSVPITLKLTSCAVYIGGMLRVSDYNYSGYQFDEEIILPQTTRTLGKIWITDKIDQKKINSGDYLMLCLRDVENCSTYHIKYVYRKEPSYEGWKEIHWLRVNDK